MFQMANGQDFPSFQSVSGQDVTNQWTEADVNAAYEYYKNVYTQIYGNPATAQTQTETKDGIANVKNKIASLLEKQDFSMPNLGNMVGAETGVGNVYLKTFNCS